jgi:o-succinylbenzoate---CoA ligase
MPVPAGPSALSVLPAVEAALDGGHPMLPVPADDVVQTRLLTTTLRIDEAIDDDVAAVVSTSGTTGAPKGAMLTATAMTASADATHSRLGGPGQWLLVLPAHHIAGLQVLVRSVLSGQVPVALSARFDATELPAAVAAMRPGRRYASLVAAQLARALVDPAACAALAELDAILIGGGPTPLRVAERAAEANISLVRTYGMSETAGGCVYDGAPLDGVRVRVDVDGRIALGGVTLAKGYRNPPQHDPFAEPGWFLTDDVGVLDSSGTLRVLGRTDDAISTGGLTVFPQLVENALSSHPRVVDCAVFGVPDDRLGQRVVAAVVAADGYTVPTLEELRTHVKTLLDPTAAPRELHIVEELPRRGIGKLDRRKLVARFGD